MRSRIRRTGASGPFPRAVTIFAAGLLLAAASVAHAEEANAADADALKADETYTAMAMNLNAGPGPNTSRMTIRVRAWTSDEQRAGLLKVLAEKGSEALRDALQDQKPVGTLSFTGTLGYDLRYARVVQQGETRHLVLATDRPVGMAEVMRNSRTLDNGVTIVHLALDAQGKGAGELIVGAELALDTERHDLSIESVTSQPVKLTQVEREEKKKK